MKKIIIIIAVIAGIVFFNLAGRAVQTEIQNATAKATATSNTVNQ